MFERFTDRARKVMQLANEVAVRFDHPAITTEHILWGLLKEGSGVGANTFRSLGFNVSSLAAEIYNRFVPGTESPVPPGRAGSSVGAKYVIERAIIEARRLDLNYVGTEHILLGILASPQDSAAAILRSKGVHFDAAREVVISLLGRTPPKQPMPSSLDALKGLLIAIDEEILRLEDAKNEAVQQADYERAAELRDRGEAVKSRLQPLAQEMSQLLSELKGANEQDRK